VSIKLNILLSFLIDAVLISLVKPSCSDTKADFDFASLLKIEDLPTLVLPTSETVVLI
jgi:hypothetical protein